MKHTCNLCGKEMETNLAFAHGWAYTDYGEMCDKCYEGLVFVRASAAMKYNTAINKYLSSIKKARVAK